MTVRRRILCLVALGLLTGTGSGCRLFNKGGSSDGGWALGTRDPLFGRDRIPATNLPTGRENARGTKDPLLVTPTAEGEKLSSDLPPGGGRKEPFRTGPETTAAGLAGGRNDPLLAVRADEPDDRRPTGSSTGRGPVLLQPGPGGAAFEQTVGELRRYGIKVGEPVREGSDFVLRGETESAAGVRRRYEGAGPTAAAAASDLLEQVRSEGR
jgi:hypothetical protein